MNAWNDLPLLASLLPESDEMLIRPTGGPVNRASVQALIDAITASAQLKNLPATVFTAASNDIDATMRGRLVVANRNAAITFAMLAVASAGEGFTCFAMNRGTGTLTLDPDGAELINGVSTLSMVTGDAALLVVENGEWRAFVFGAVATANAAAYRALTPGKVITTDAVAGGLAEVTLTDAATITWDMSTGIDFVVTLGGNRTLGNPSNTTVGKRGRIRVVQDGAGNRTLARSSNLKTAGGNDLVLSSGSGAVDFIDYDVVSATFIRLAVSKDWD